MLKCIETKFITSPVLIRDAGESLDEASLLSTKSFRERESLRVLCLFSLRAIVVRIEKKVVKPE